MAEAGIAYRVKLMPVKVCLGFWELQFVMSASGFRGFLPAEIGGCPTSEIADGIRYAADRGAKVINLSLGGPEPSDTLRDAIRYATGKGAFVAIAMGNEYEFGNPVDYPAAYAAEMNGVMSVGAVGPSLARSFYSNTGPHLGDLGAGRRRPRGRRERDDLAVDDRPERLDPHRRRRTAFRPIRRIRLRRHIDGDAARRGRGGIADQSRRVESGRGGNRAQEHRRGRSARRRASASETTTTAMGSSSRGRRCSAWDW